MYVIGRAENPNHDDPDFDTEAEAIEAAKRAATGDLVYAVWRRDGEEDYVTLYLVYQGDMWKPA